MPTEIIDPNQFIITRKRKKYRFALFRNADNCFEFEDWKKFYKQNSKNFREITLEMGAGTGLFLVELARNNPGATYIAVDVKADRLQKGACAALDAGLSNIYFVRARADQVLEITGVGAVQSIWLTFSDPFPKKRDAKRRLTHPKFLDLYKKAHVGKNAYLYFKTDAHDLFDWSLEQLVATKWHLEELSFDLHDSVLSAEYKTMTTYEKRWTSEGAKIYFVKARSAK